ncbi:MAG: DUF5110 domain-containing protein [Oscillatoriales cyanobacterium RM2_1_1]|nr:DUF5110 domain-containing protein [Oscillatoriales cyanobacterium SM2_3_0]NJO46000.1 DUF5110 domain-containing protein [Oscillatoriales cyanobacterium RM2_1_1]
MNFHQLRTLTVGLTFSTFLGLLNGIVIQPATAEVFRTRFKTDSAYLIVEVLDDDLIHFELSTQPLPSLTRPIYTSPMVFKTDYSGPSRLFQQFNQLETEAIKLTIDPETLCISAYDKTRSAALLTRLCPRDLEQEFKGFSIEPGTMEHVYGLGQQFTRLGSADGDWTTLGVREGMEFGNGFQGFQNAAVGNVQIPVYYALGPDNLNYALFVDNVYKQQWDFRQSPWQARMFGDRLRFYLMVGSSLPDLRADFMELTGRPPVPPRKAFGLWVSEFGYDNWEQVDALKAGLRANHFPLDGFVLDLNWFGGVALENPAKSNMGRLDWDENQSEFLRNNNYFFPDPSRKIQEYIEDYIGLMAIEESYLANTVDTFQEMPPDLTVYRRTQGNCHARNQNQPATDIAGFWGIGRMIDWSDPQAGIWIHRQRRYPNLVRQGIHGHWTDLGEPETFDPRGCYEGVEMTQSGIKNEHPDLHNLYNLLWNQSIWQGYFAQRGRADALGTVNPRPFILTRSGAAGTQRYGTAMWSGDIASNLQSLATHFNAQMHLAFSGIDYYGSDIGGFRREVMPFNDKQGSYRGYETELYTQWFANGAWFDLPVRPHTDNEFVVVNPPYETSPDRVGNVESNLANLRQRYELIPYYYSLAYRAYLFGEPLIPPPVFYDQTDQNLRQIGHQKLIGRDILVGVVAQHGEYERDVYLPQGQWVNYHSNEWSSSQGEWLKNVPVYRGEILRLPTFVRAGAILPLMAVDENTLDGFGHRPPGDPPRNELILRVYSGSEPSSFTLYEDDGMTLKYLPDGSPIYQYRTTTIHQTPSDQKVRVIIEPTINLNGQYPFLGAVERRNNQVELMVNQAEATDVKFNGRALEQHTSLLKFRLSDRGWYNASNHKILAKSGEMSVDRTKQFEFQLQTIPAQTSVNFVCGNGPTATAGTVYIGGNHPELGNWNLDQAIPLNPSIDYEYMTHPPTAGDRPGPRATIWTGIVGNLPPNQALEWKCLERDSSGAIRWEPGANHQHLTSSSGYTGRSYGQF